jgi:hypothetical protein
VADDLRLDSPRSFIGFRATLDSTPVATISANGLRLCIEGIRIDRIVALGEPMPLAPGIGKFSHLPILDSIRRWIQECQAIYKSYFSACLSLLSIDYTQCIPSRQHGIGHLHHRDRYHNFVRTLIWDQPFQGQTLEQTILEATDYLRGILTSEEVIFAAAGGGYVSTTIYNEDRRLCLTTSGRIGYVPATTGLGDVVCLLHGGSLPYVLRKCGNGEYVFLGDCFIEGEMYGAGMGTGAEVESFTLI